MEDTVKPIEAPAHPVAAWLRGGPWALVCERCDARFDASRVGLDEREAAAERFILRHLHEAAA